jgi:peroxiredoxin
MTDRDLIALTVSAERRWMDSWLAGPTHEGDPVRRGDRAPDLELTAEDGSRVSLSSYWDGTPALVMLWRHLGCGCGLERIERLKTEFDDYITSGLNVVVVAPGEIERVVAYKQRYLLPTQVLADPEYQTHKAFGLSHWSREQALYDAPDHYCNLGEETGHEFQEERRAMGRPLVDDPWMQSAEFIVGADGVIRVAYFYNYCADYPDPRVFLTAARLATEAA